MSDERTSPIGRTISPRQWRRCSARASASSTRLANLAVALGVSLALPACGGNGTDTDPTGAASADESPGHAVELPACEAPTIDPIGGSVQAGTAVTIHAPSGFPSPETGARVLYTMDGTKPSVANGVMYDAPIPIASNRTIEAVAVAPGVCTASAVAASSFIIDLGEDLTAPAFDPPSTTEDHPFAVNLSDGATAATICFTVDGSTPACMVSGGAATCKGGATTYEASAGIGQPGSVSITPPIVDPDTGTVVVTAIACAVGAPLSSIVSQQYTLKESPVQPPGQ
ncbi:MAG TPA: chitobiase/beta-hexosaminidase C-terminal domain-containing protein [Polyangiaceae bacterium]|jgi:hypothetical protein